MFFLNFRVIERLLWKLTFVVVLVDYFFSFFFLEQEFLEVRRLYVMKIKLKIFLSEGSLEKGENEVIVEYRVSFKKKVFVFLLIFKLRKERK